MGNYKSYLQVLHMYQAGTPNKQTKSLIATKRKQNGKLDGIQPTTVNKYPHQNVKIVIHTTQQIR